MPEHAYSIILLPQDNYYGWAEAARAYGLHFGAVLTADLHSAGKYMRPQQVITLVTAADVYPVGDGVAWFIQHYPEVKLDPLAADTPAELKRLLNLRLEQNDQFAPVPPQPQPPVPPPVVYPWPPGKCLVGLHGRADGRMQAADFQVVQAAQVEAVKLLSTAAPEDVDQLRALRPDMFILLRLMAAFEGRRVSAADFVNWTGGDFAPFYDRGVRYVEVHNEPNLVLEGWQTSWRDGSEFGNWFVEVVRGLRARFPEARFGWPGLSPGFGFDRRMKDWDFLNGATSTAALHTADWLGVHCYWQSPALMEDEAEGGSVYKQYRRRFPDKLLFITEFSNATEAPGLKAPQYVEYYRRLRNEPGLGAAFAFVVSCSGQFHSEAWRSEDGALNELARTVGARAWV